MFNSVFDGCTSLEEVGKNMLVSPVKLTSVAISSAIAVLRSVPVSLFDEAVKLKTLTSTFQGCASLEGESPYTSSTV